VQQQALLDFARAMAGLFTGETLTAPGLSARERARLRRLQRRLARAGRGSVRRGKARIAVARLHATSRRGTP
jgi:putative transposase